MAGALDDSLIILLVFRLSTNDRHHYELEGELSLVCDLWPAVNLVCYLCSINSYVRIVFLGNCQTFRTLRGFRYLCKGQNACTFK